MSTKEEYEKPEISVCYFEQVLYLFAKRVLKAKLRRLSTIFPRKLPVYYQIV